MKEIERAIKLIRGQDGTEARSNATKRIEQLVMPFRALGRILDLAEDLAEITGKCPPPVERKAIVVMAGDHGVTDEATSKYPKQVTVQMVHNFVGGRAGISALSRQIGAKVIVVDMGVEGDLGSLIVEGKIMSKSIGKGTANIAKGPAMSRNNAIKSVEAGIEVALMLTLDVDVFGTGDMGIGNTTPSSAIVSLLCDVPPSDVTGRGTGIDDMALAHKIEVVQRALSANQPDPRDGLDVLAKIGGFEIGGIAGLILGAASMSKPIVVDGFISTAGALIASLIAPESRKFMIAAHRSKEPGHIIALEHLGFRPLLDLEMGLGEGTGSALAMYLVDAAVRVLTEMATFDEAAVSKADK